MAKGETKQNNAKTNKNQYCSLNSPFPFIILNFKRNDMLSHDFNMYQMAVIDQDLYLKFLAKSDKIYMRYDQNIQ